MLVDDLDAVCKENTGRQCAAVHDNRSSISSIPAIDLDTATAFCQCNNVSLGARLSGNLTAKKVGVVRAGNKVLAQGSIQRLAGASRIDGLEEWCASYHQILEGGKVHGQFARSGSGGIFWPTFASVLVEDVLVVVGFAGDIDLLPQTEESEEGIKVEFGDSRNLDLVEDLLNVVTRSDALAEALERDTLQR